MSGQPQPPGSALEMHQAASGGGGGGGGGGGLDWRRFPDNHSSYEEFIAASTLQRVPRPSDWFRPPAANPLDDRALFRAFHQLPLMWPMWPFCDEFQLRSAQPAFWMLLAEITDDSNLGVSLAFNQVTARDIAGDDFIVSFCPKLDSGQFNYESLRVGSTAVFCCPFSRAFISGYFGLAMEHLETMRVLPMSLQAVLDCAQRVFDYSVHKCWQCKSESSKQPLMRCSGCGYARYCGVQCQLADLARHRAECQQHNVRKIARLVYFAYWTAVKQQVKDNLRVAHPFDLFVRAE